MGRCFSKSSKKNIIQTDFKDSKENPKKEEQEQPKPNNAHDNKVEKLEENEKKFGEFNENESLPKKTIDRKNSIILNYSKLNPFYYLR